MHETMTEIASKARDKASRVKVTIAESVQTAAGSAKDAAKRGAETVGRVLENDDVKIVVEEGIEIGKTGAKEFKKAAIWAASIDSVRRSIGGAVVGALVFGFVGWMIPGGFFFLGVKIGLAIGLVLGFLRK